MENNIIKLMVLGTRNNQIISNILKNNKKNCKHSLNGVYYIDNSLMASDGVSAIKITSDYFSFNGQPEAGKHRVSCRSGRRWTG